MTTNTTARKKPNPATRTKTGAKARLEARVDADLDQLITEAAEKQGVSKTAFVSDAARDAALKVITRADVTLMAAEVFDQMMASIAIPPTTPPSWKSWQPCLTASPSSCPVNHPESRSPSPTYRVSKLAPGYDLGAFDCGEPTYNDWLSRHGAASVQAGVAAVYLLLEEAEDQPRVVGYYAINPTQVIRDDVPTSFSRGWPRAVPAWKLGKLAIHVDLRADKPAQWGRHLLRDALETIVRVADAGGGKVDLVDADHERLLGFYVRNGFKSIGTGGELSLYMKVSNARKALGIRCPTSTAPTGRPVDQGLVRDPPYPATEA